MKRKVIFYAGTLLVLSQACNNNSEKAEEPAMTDTAVKAETAPAPAVIDSAAVVAYYQAQHAKAKGTPNTNSKAKGAKKVSVDSHPAFTSSDAIAPAAPAAANAQPEVKVVYDVQMFYFIPDENASFPGGEKAFDKYLLDNLEYPEKALEAGVSRTVYPTLFLDEQGNPVNVEFRYEPTIYGFQDEARRILMSCPRWNPAKVGGKPVKSKFTIPISFKMED